MGTTDPGGARKAHARGGAAKKRKINWRVWAPRFAAGTLFAVAGVWWGSRATQEAAQGPLPPNAPASAPETGEDGSPENARMDAQMDAAARVWAAYDKLPASARTANAWRDAVVESAAHGQGLAPPFDRKFAAANAAVARKYGAAVFNPESTAAGEGYTVLVPSPDHTRCLIWGSQWSHEAESLRTFGFVKLRCEAYTYVSKLTGDTVVEPAREWVVR